MARMFAAQVQAAHRQITDALIPAGEPGERDWTATGPYARQHLAAHAAAYGALDALASDPGFLLVTEPAAIVSPTRDAAHPGRLSARWPPSTSACTTGTH